MANNGNVSIDLLVNDLTEKGLKSALSNISSWSKKATKDAIIEVGVELNDKDMQMLGAEFNKMTASLKRKLGKFSFDGLIDGKNRTIDFSKDFISDINLNSARTALNQLYSLRQKIDSGAATSSSWTSKDNKNLNETIKLLEQTTQGYKKLQNAQHSITSNLLGHESLFTRLTSLAGRYFSAHQIVQFGKEIAKTTGYFEQQQVALEGILHSASAARNVIEQIKSLALESPFQTSDLVTSLKQLAAYNIEESKLVETTKQLADISAGLGVSMDRLILAYGQVKSQSVLRGQELRQFTEAGVPMVQLLADKFSDLNGELVTTGEVFKLVSQRKVSFEMVAEVLADMTKEGGKFYKMQERLTDTLYGQMEKLKDMWTLAKDNIGKSYSSPLMFIIKMMQQAIKNARTLFAIIASAAVPSTIQKIQSAFAGTRNEAKLLQTVITNTIINIRTAKTATEKWKFAFKGVGAAANVAASVISVALSIIVGHISKAIRNYKEFKDAINEVNVSFEKDTQNLKRGLDSLLYKLSANTKETKQFADALETLKTNYKDFVSPDWIDSLVNSLKQEQDSVDLTADSWVRLRDSIISAIDAKQEYEKSKAKKQTAGDKIVEEYGESDFETIIRRLSNRLSFASTQGGNAYYATQSLTLSTYKYDAAEFLADAVSDFFERGLTDNSQLKSIFREKAKAANKEFIADAMEPFFDELTNDIFSGRKWNEYLRQNERMTSSPLNAIYNKFEGAKNDVLSYSGRGIEREKYIDEKASSTAKSLIDGFTDKIDASKIEDVDKYNKALKNLNNVFESDWDYGKTKALADAMVQLANSVKDGVLLTNLREISRQFNEMTTQRTGTAKTIANNISDYLEKNPLLSNEFRDFFLNYIPDDSTLLSKRDDLINKFKGNRDFMKGHKKEGVWKDEYVKRERENQTIEILFGKNFYDVDKSQIKGSEKSSEQVPLELSEFINNMKTAYEVYKKATEGMGAQMGLGYMKNDTKMQQQFGGFFDKNLENVFKDEEGNLIKIGGKAVREIVEEAFIKEGIEKGVINFEDAMRAVAKAMDEYAGNSKYRKQFKNLAKSITQTADNMAKDNLNGKILEMNTSLERLSRTFNMSKDAINVYRQLMVKGIDEQYGGNLGISGKQAITPDSALARKFVNSNLALFNNMAQEVNSTPINLGDTTTYSGVTDAIKKLNELMQVQGFKVKELGTVGQKLINSLETLRKTYEEELNRISGKTFTGDALSDAIANAVTSLRGAQNKLNIANSNSQLSDIDQGTLEEYMQAVENAAKSIFEQYQKRNPFESFMFGKGNRIGSKNGIDMKNLEKNFKERVGFDAMPEALQIELRSAIRDLQTSVNQFNSNIISFSTIFNGFGTIANARGEAKQVYQNTLGEYNNAQAQVSLVKTKQSMGAYATDEEFKAALAAAEAKVAALKEELAKLGHDGEKLAQKTIIDTLNNMKSSADTLSNTFNSMAGAVSAIVNAFRSFTSVIRKVYDIMNDGENPEWMEQLDGYLEDFLTNFEALIAPISAVLALIGTMIVLVITLTAATATLEAVMTPLLIIMAAVIATAAIIAAIIAAVQAHDKKLQKEIENLDKHIDKLENDMKNLNDMAERMTGWEKFETQIEAISKGFYEAVDALQKYHKEMEKDNTDVDKANEYYQDYIEKLNEFVNSIKEKNDELTGSVDDWASSISDALRNAFQNGENAARSLRDTVKEMIGDIMQRMIEMSVIQPMMENAMKTLLGGTPEDFAIAAAGDPKKYMMLIKNRLTDEAAVKAFEEEVYGIQDAVLQFGDSLGGLWDYFAHNSELSSLSGGIENITEDTARRLEALSNSQLGELVFIRKAVESLALTSDSTMLPTIQAEAVKMNSTLTAMLAMSTAINTAINDMRNGVRPMKVYM